MNLLEGVERENN